MSDETLYDREEDFFKGYGEEDKDGAPIEPAKEEEEGEAGELGEEEEAGHSYPEVKPREKEPEGPMIYDKSPEIYPTGEKKETLLDPDKSKEFARQQYPHSPALAGEEEKIQNFVEVLSLTGVPILQQRGYPDLKDCLAKCQPCRDLQDGEIKDQDLSHIVINSSRFKNGLLEKVSFEGTTAWNSDFSSCELINVNFDNADLRGSSFRDCDLSSCSFKNANLTNVNMVNCELPPADEMRGADLSGILRTEREEKLSAQPGIFPA